MSAEVKLRLVRQGLAQSYYFEGAPAGWASCVVNDATGELMIQSDRGAGAYRWNTAGLGVPTLTEFIAGVDTDTDYLARKLLGRDGMERFDPAVTTRNLFRAIIERRRNGRLDRAAAREAWEALIDATLPYWDAAAYWSHVPAEVIEILDPGEFAAYESSTEARAFKGWILPALIDACKVEVQRRIAPPDPLATVKAALEAHGRATPGPLMVQEFVCGDDGYGAHVIDVDTGETVATCDDADRCDEARLVDEAAAIVAMHNAAPAIAALVDEVERLRAEVDAMRFDAHLRAAFSGDR